MLWLAVRVVETGCRVLGIPVVGAGCRELACRCWCPGNKPPLAAVKGDQAPLLTMKCKQSWAA